MRSRREFLALSAAGALAWRSTMLMAQTTDPRADAKYLDSKIRHISDDELFASLDFSPRDYGAWGRHWDQVAPKRELFRDIDDFLVFREEASSSFANGKATVLAQAEEVLKHNIKGWGPVAIQHGPVVDFNADYGQSGKYGFHYWGWARPLVVAFLLTADQKYLDEFEALVNSWYDQRDKVVGGFPNLDVVYYELGLGVRNRLFFEYYFLPQAKRKVQTHERLLKTFLGSARWLYEEQMLGYRPHNWQMIGAFGLAHIAAMMPEFRESKRWLELATQRMLEHVAQDFYADGCFSERCPSSYNIIAYRDPRNLGLLLPLDKKGDKKGDVPLFYRAPELSEKGVRPLFPAARLQAQLEAQENFLTHVVAPDGYLPGINDGARAKLLKPILARRKADAKPSAHFAPSGFTVMRSDFTPEARYLLINHGPFGGGHSHADTLSFELHGFGQALAIDCGIGDTYDDPNWSSWYVHAKAHNMLTIDLEDPDRAAAAGTDVVWTSNDRYDHFAATHRGYEKSKGIVHRRHVLFVKPDYFVVYDVIDASAAKAEHSAEWNLHPTVALAKATGPGLIVATSDDWAKHSEISWASVVGIRGFEDKQQAQIEWLRFGNRLKPGEKRTFGVLLFPFAGARPEVTIKAVSANQFAVGRETITFNDRSVELQAH